MSVREELHAMAVRLHEIFQHESDGLSNDEGTAILTSMQLLDWVAKPPEEVKVVVKKPSITFGQFTLGDH